MKEGKTLETFRLIAKIFLIIECIIGVVIIYPTIISIIGLKYLNGIEKNKRARELALPICIAAFGNIIAGLFLILDYTAHSQDETSEIYSDETMSALQGWSIVALILFMFLFPVGTITSIIGIVYLSRIKNDNGNRVLAIPIILLIIGNTIAACTFFVDYFADKYVDERQGQEVKSDHRIENVVEQKPKASEQTKAEQMAASKIFEKEFGVKEENNVPVTAPKKKSSTPRLIAYTAIIGGLTLGAVSLFTFSQYEMAKYKASKEVINSAGQLIEGVYRSDSTIVIIETDEKTDEKTYKLNTDVSDEKKESDLYKHAAYLVEVYNHFNIVKVLNNVFYVVTALPSYLLSMSALISVGLILNHSEKVKEKEEKEV